MTTALIGVMIVSAMVLVALRANRRLQSEDRLPMQWLLPDEVVWSAPRLIALACLPALALLIFAGLTALSIYERPRPGQEEMLFPVLLGIGLILLAVQLFHLWMIERALTRNGR